MLFVLFINRSNELYQLYNSLNLLCFSPKKNLQGPFPWLLLVFLFFFVFFFLSLYSCLFLSTVQLMFGRFGQVVEKKKSISLQDISAVRFNPSYLSIHQAIPLSACLILSVLLFLRKSAGSCPVCWAARSPRCFVSPSSAGPLVMWWRWRAPLTNRVDRGETPEVFQIVFLEILCPKMTWLYGKIVDDCIAISCD